MAKSSIFPPPQTNTCQFLPCFFLPALVKIFMAPFRFSLLCIKMCKRSWNWQLKGKIGKKFIKSRDNIHELQERWQNIIIFLQLSLSLFCWIYSPGGHFWPKYLPLHRGQRGVPLYTLERYQQILQMVVNAIIIRALRYKPGYVASFFGRI